MNTIITFHHKNLTPKAILESDSENLLQYLEDLEKKYTLEAQDLNNLGIYLIESLKFSRNSWTKMVNSGFFRIRKLTF